jgi:hypothetical protein
VNVVDFDDKYIVSASGDRTIKVIGGGATMVVLVLFMVLLCGATYCPGGDLQDDRGGALHEDPGSKAFMAMF